ncbi:hypothetical protein OEA41_000137 [Lepraria neglecta]|uniref:Cytochrome b5 heme-binding domain-containing protein n=1 Tax=Lepraria neglecta TaxID=209136 RepID=A0AAD9ZFX5_9LECA|nr:hypothetical protein OEA41_000137 [Lepraria neglecta]
MVFLGIGILVVSLSVALYKYRFSATWAQKERSEKTDHAPRITELEDDREDTDRKERPSIPTLKLDEGDDKGYAPTKSDDAPQALQPAAILQTKPAAQANAMEQSSKTTMPPPAFPSPNAKRKPDQPPASLMRPPSRPTPSPPTFKTPPKPSKTLRPPPSTASTLRVPPSRSPAPPTSSIAPTTSILSPSARPSKKVLLDPGHSPLDWAHLTANLPTPTFLRGKDVPPQLIRVPPSLLNYHSGRKGKDAWGVWQGKVYNLTPYMKFHPGGVDQLMRGAGKEREGERLFNEIHPWVSWENMLGECLVGILVGEGEVQANGEVEENALEEMD